jgi:hypothetical protein
LETLLRRRFRVVTVLSVLQDDAAERGRRLTAEDDSGVGVFIEITLLEQDGAVCFGLE